MEPNPYDYLLNPQVPQKKPFLFGSGKPNKLVMAVFILVVLVLVFAVVAVFSALTSKDYDAVIGLAQRQQEIVRVADLGLQKVQDPSTKYYVATLRGTTLSEQNDTTAFLKKKGVKLNAKQLALKKDADTDAALKKSEQDNSFDKTLLSALNDLVDSYHTAQKRVDGINDSTSEEELFSTLFANAKVISPQE